MKTRFLFSIILFVALIFSFGSKAEITDGVAAVVNDEVIFLSDLKSHIQNSGENPLNKKVYYKYLRELVDIKLLEIQGGRMGIQATEERLDMVEKQLREKNGSKKFDEELKRSGVSLYRVRFGWKNQMLQEAITTIVLRNKVVITEKEILKRYISTYGEIQEENLVDLSIIVIDKNKVKDNQIKSIEENLRATTKIDSLINELLVSKQIEPPSGNLGSLNPKDLDEKIADAISSSKEGEVLGPFYSDNLVKFFVIGKRQYGDMNYIKNKDKVYETIYQEKSLALLDKWFQELRDNSYISIRI